MLSSRILQLSESLNEPERDNLKLLLGMAAGQLIPSDAEEVDSARFEAYKTVASCLARLQPHRDRVPKNGIAWRGRPSFLDHAMLNSLREEATRERQSALRHDEHFLGCGGILANELASSTDLLSLVEGVAGSVAATGTASYIYYDEPGQNICPHIDTGIFSVNALFMLRHDFVDRPLSSLQLYPVDAPRETLQLEPGELIVFWADSVVHARTSVGPGEVVNILTVGFSPNVVDD
ncbi:hypothetical protein FHS82_004046 [Pseudochelatococcus lubricantis]|uniref:Fe2OG dioxygenase domain-containing protein n=1 Tax=Pseudochelatococcus lubricantis TaxID=1538102 RepID=A0ABX0V6T3_9HYPH|nr:hypothetical protein [Pseudochelatococcus lubricantis]NIJ60179.1 hypothetical protein [Pseudochelatococcus lubricantis]